MLKPNLRLIQNYIFFLQNNGINPDPIPNDGDFTIQVAYWNQLYQDYVNIVTNNPGGIPATLPVEPHPYINQHPVDYTRSKIIIGTMPPISHMAIENDIQGLNPPPIPFFHGNMGALWSLIGDDNLRNLLDDNNLHTENIQEYLTLNDCAYPISLPFASETKEMPMMPTFTISYPI